jgi:hypothetical protein
MISDDDVETALEYLENSASPAASARADRVYVEAYRSSLEALLMKESDDGETAAVIQKRNAHMHKTYLAHLNAIRDAVFEDERHRFLREAAQARIQAWQTMSANQRGKIL